MILIGDRVEQGLGLLPPLVLIPSSLGPILHDAPVGPDCSVCFDLVLQRVAQAGAGYEPHEVVRRDILDEAPIWREVVPSDLLGDAGLETALDRVAAQIIRCGVPAVREQDASVIETH